MFRNIVVRAEPVEEFQKPTLRQEVERIGVLPSYSLYLGTAYKDGLPILLNLDNPTGHVIVYSKKPFPFRTIKKARRVFKFWSERRPIEIVHISVSDLHTELGFQKIRALRKWAEKGNLTVVLLEDITQTFRYRDSVQDIEWLLENGARKKMLVIAQSKRELPREWHTLFRTPIYQAQEANYVIKQARGRISFFVPEI